MVSRNGDSFTTRLGLIVTATGGTRLEIEGAGQRIEARGFPLNGGVTWTRIEIEADDDQDQAVTQAVADADSVSRGEALYRGGNTTTGVSACMACHGPTGHGNPAAKYPALQGQHAVYTAKQLNDYASGARTTDGKTRIMRDIAGRLSKEDIAALSSYVQGLR